MEGVKNMSKRYLVKKKIKSGDCRDLSLYDEGFYRQCNPETWIYLSRKVDSFFVENGTYFVLTKYDGELAFIPVSQEV
jgi:hypothetical protein